MGRHNHILSHETLVKSSRKHHTQDATYAKHRLKTIKTLICTRIRSCTHTHMHMSDVGCKQSLNKAQNKLKKEGWQGEYFIGIGNDKTTTGVLGLCFEICIKQIIMQLFCNKYFDWLERQNLRT